MKIEMKIGRFDKFVADYFYLLSGLGLGLKLGLGLGLGVRLGLGVGLGLLG